MKVRQGGKETGRSALFFSTDPLLPSVVSEPSYTTVIVRRKDTARCFPGERSNYAWIVVVATHIIVVFQNILFFFHLGKKSFVLRFLSVGHFVLTVGCLGSERNFPLSISAAVMRLGPRREQGWAVPCHSMQQEESSASAKTDEFHLNCLLSNRQGQDTWCTLKVSVPLSDSVCLSLWRPPFISLFLSFSPLALQGEIHMPHTHYGYSESFVMYFLLHSSYILCLHVSTSWQVWTQGQPSQTFYGNTYSGLAGQWIPGISCFLKSNWDSNFNSIPIFSK